MLDKTLTDVYRRNLDLDKYHVYDVLPGHFDDKYPKLVKFLQEYYKTLEEEGNVAETLNDLLLNRDIAGAKVELLDFIANELLLGKPYYESFNDKRTSLQYSNLLYRSKGTEFSIKQFFRVFYGLDIEVRYGKDEVFFVGDPNEEEMIFAGNGEATGRNFPYTFKGSDIVVSVTDSNGDYIQLRQDLDYTVDFAKQAIVLQTLDSAGLLLEPAASNKFDSDGSGNPIIDSDSKISYLANKALLAPGQDLKVEATRRSYSTIGTELTLKRITDNTFYQLYGILISTPIGVPVWRDAYKTFVHPAGMYLAGQVQINSIFDFNLGPQPSFIEPPPPIDVFSTAQIMQKFVGGKFVADKFDSGFTPTDFLNDRNGTGLFSTSITEIGPGPYGERIRTRVNDMNHPRNIENWHTQYGSVYQADNIEARTLDDTYADLSNIINPLDEDRWYGYDSNGSGMQTTIYSTYDSNVYHGVGGYDAWAATQGSHREPLLESNTPNLIQYTEYPNLNPGDNN